MNGHTSNRMGGTTIDGSLGEGGGQILRNVCAYATILRKDVKIVNIRAGRKVPGLRPQHLVGLRLLEEVSGACLKEGNLTGATKVLLLSDKIRPDDDRKPAIERHEYIGDTQTAGSVCLLLQTILPFVIFSGASNGLCGMRQNGSTRFILKGGTDTDFAPPVEYFQYIFIPMLTRSFGLDAETSSGSPIDLSVIKRGFFPAGGGEVHATIRRPSLNSFPLPPIKLTDRGKFVRITVRAFSSGNCPRHRAVTLSEAVRSKLLSNALCRDMEVIINISEESWKSSTSYPEKKPKGKYRMDKRGTKRPRSKGSGCGVLLIAETNTGCRLGGSAIASFKTPLEETANQATKQLFDAMECGGCVDDYLQDQLIVYMALAGGISEVLTSSFTSHTRTAIWSASQMIPSVRFEVTNLDGNVNQEATVYLRENRNTVSKCYIDASRDKVPGRHLIRCHGIGLRPVDQCIA